MDDDEASGDDHTRRAAGIRRSVSLFAKIHSLDLTALIRSSSLSSRRVSGHESRPQSRHSTLDYVKQEILDDMANARSSRPTKPDAGILNLITQSRSRSRSRSKGGEEAVTADVPELPVEAGLQDPSPENPHKPPALLQSRPLSAATTNTASTVTPTNVTPRKRPPTRIPIAPVQEEPASAPKQTQGTPKKNFHIFGIPLPSPRKSSFGSRPTTPSEVSAAPVRRKSSPSPRRAAAASPTPKPNAKLAKPKPKPEIGQGAASPSRLDNLSKMFFVGTGLRVSSNPEPSKPAVKPTASKIPTLKHSPASQKPGGAHVSPGVVAHISPSTVVADPAIAKAATKQPSRKYMSEVGNMARVQEPTTPTTPAPRVQSSSMSSVGGSTARARISGTSAIGSSSAPQIRSSISNPRTSILSPRASVTSSPLASTPTPRVRAISTGAGPTQSAIGISARMSTTTTTTVSSVSTRDRRQSSTDSSYVYRAYRPNPRLGGIEEDRWKGKGVEEETDNNEIANSTAPGRPARASAIDGRPVRSTTNVVTPTTVSAMPIATKAKSTVGTASGRKHGSFDFERPGWGTGAVKGAASSLGVSSRTRRDQMRGASGSVDGRAERKAEAGLAGVGAARLYASTSAAQRSVRVVPPPPPPAPLQPDNTGASTSTAASQSHETGGTSSWGRSTGKRLSAGLTRLTNGLGLSKSSKSTIGVAKERQHGKFAFEPPVPALPIGVRREQSMDSERERERERKWEREEKERRTKPQLPSGKGHNTSHSTSSTTSSTHTGVSAGHRSGNKGRSLDLGLGLAWAPSKVREDAVMPESSFGRSLSASRREKQGKEIADVFRNALDEDGYRSFKKYVHRFDAHEIPFDGPTGIVTRVERLLRKAQHIDDDERARLLDNFVKLILQNA